jgi:sensor histidine kinase YesM
MKKLHSIYWYRLSIRNKLMLFFCVLIVFPSILTMYSQYAGHKAMDDSFLNLKGYFKIYQLKMKIDEDKTLLQSYIQHGGKPALDQVQASHKEIEGILVELRNEVDTTEVYLVQKSIDFFWRSYIEQGDLAIVLRDEQDSNSNYYKPFFQALNVSGYLEGRMSDLINIRLSEGNQYFLKLLDKANVVKNFVLIGNSLIIVLVMVFGYLFSKNLTLPIQQLALASIQMSAGKLDINKINVNSADEVGILARSFNKMSSNIRRLVKNLEEKSLIENRLHEEEVKNIKMQKLLNDAQFMGLQAQINPHYLFNTLNMISRNSMFEGADKTTLLIQSLSKIFRYHLEDHSKAVSLKKELDIVKEYIFIQNERFSGRIQVELQCDQQLDTENIVIPCFTIQPIVENGISHGLESLEEGGKMRISVREREDHVAISIVDNGVGMQKEKVTKLVTDSVEEGVAGIGISNVMNRLRLFFNHECLAIKSKPGIGTRITIRIPLRKEEPSIE